MRIETKWMTYMLRKRLELGEGETPVPVRVVLVWCR